MHCSEYNLTSKPSARDDTRECVRSQLLFRLESGSPSDRCAPAHRAESRDAAGDLKILIATG